jgi:hypothetical protein
MRVRPAPPSPFYPKLRVAVTDHPINVWAGFCSGCISNCSACGPRSSRCLGPSRRPRTVRFRPSAWCWPGGAA